MAWDSVGLQRQAHVRGILALGEVNGGHSEGYVECDHKFPPPENPSISNPHLKPFTAPTESLSGNDMTRRTTFKLRWSNNSQEVR